MGTIVINQTDCKQNVVLQSSVDGITGGYYDAAGLWHEIGGESDTIIKNGFFLIWRAAFTTDDETGNFTYNGNNSQRCLYAGQAGSVEPVYEHTAGFEDTWPFPAKLEGTKITVSKKDGETRDFYASVTILDLVEGEYIRTYNTGFSQVGTGIEFDLSEHLGEFFYINMKIGEAGSTSITTNPGLNIVQS